MLEHPPKEISQDILSVTVPNPATQTNVMSSSIDNSKSLPSHLIDPGKYSLFSRLVGVTSKVLKFVNKLKCTLKSSDCTKDYHLETFPVDHNFHDEAFKLIISTDQQIHFDDTFKYFRADKVSQSDIPRLVTQFNIYLD